MGKWSCTESMLGKFLAFICGDLLYMTIFFFLLNQIFFESSKSFVLKSSTASISAYKISQFCWDFKLETNLNKNKTHLQIKHSQIEIISSKTSNSNQILNTQ